MESIIVALAAGVVALLFALGMAIRVLRANAGNERMQDIGAAISEGANAFLRREYIVLLPFVVVVAAVLWVLIDWYTLDSVVPKTAIAYLAGTLCSATAGFIGMFVAVRANTRTAAAAMRGLNPALRVAFSSGSVMGVSVVGIGLLGVTILYVIFPGHWSCGRVRFRRQAQSPFSPGLAAEFSPRPPTSGPTWWVRWRRESRKTTPGTPV